MITNTELFNQVYAATQIAADDLEKLANQILPGAVVTAAEFRAPIEKVRVQLQAALCAALALESRAAGNEPPKRG